MLPFCFELVCLNDKTLNTLILKMQKLIQFQNYEDIYRDQKNKSF
jgi:hypothetical protein